MEPVRLQKAIALAGIASRRAAEQLIRDGRVSINGSTVSAMGTMVTPGKDVIVVNGKPVTVASEPDTPLLYILRNDLGLKGAKFGCGLGQCGACTVLLDGHAVNACDTPLWAVEGKSVTTIEGLSAEGALDGLQQAFVDEQAVQCGYCIPGMIMSATALLRREPHATGEQVRAALERNLCRCGTHARILRAIERAIHEGAGRTA